MDACQDLQPLPGVVHLGPAGTPVLPQAQELIVILHRLRDGPFRLTDQTEPVERQRSVLGKLVEKTRPLVLRYVSKKLARFGVAA